MRRIYIYPEKIEDVFVVAAVIVVSVFYRGENVLVFWQSVENELDALHEKIMLF